MAKFRFFIVEPEGGYIFGTNDEERAKEVSRDDEYYVIDAEENKWLQDATIGEYELVRELPEKT